MDTAQWPQDIVLVKPMDQELMTSSSSNNNNNNNNNNSIGMMRPQHQQQAMERRVRPQKEQALNCPRCNSTNTKFCYYNNYSLTQPRYFCKTCRRYWTEGGSLRNVPVGGGSRKNKRSSSSTSASTPTTGAATAAVAVKKQLTEQNPKFHEGQDLNLAFPSVVPEYNNPAAASGALSAMELLRSTVGMSPFMAAMQPMGFGMQQDINRANSLSFHSLQNSVGFAGVNVNDSTANGRLLFPFEEPSSRGQLSSTPNNTEHFEQKQQQDTPGFWNGMMGGGGGGSW